VKVYLVIECDFEVSVVRGVFLTRRAAKEFVKLQLSIIKWDEFAIVAWQVEGIAQLRAKFARRKKKAAAGAAQ
jgi:hypothetical protein